MRKIFILFIILTIVSPLSAKERSPFTNINFGLFLGWGNFIKVENYEYFREDKTHFLVEVNGKDYKDIIKETKQIYKEKWKCQLAEHFIETMNKLGVPIGEKVDLKLYLFDGGHEVISVKDIPVTFENLEEIQFETDHCS